MLSKIRIEWVFVVFGILKINLNYLLESMNLLKFNFNHVYLYATMRISFFNFAHDPNFGNVVSIFDLYFCYILLLHSDFNLLQSQRLTFASIGVVISNK